MVKIFLSCSLLLAALLLAGTAHAVPVLHASADRSTVHSGQSLILTVRASAPSLPGGKPDLGTLEQTFEILAQAAKQQVVLSNGVPESSSIWQYTLLPRKDGILSIPIIRFAGAQTAAIAITVKPEPASQAQPQKQQAQAPAKPQPQTAKPPPPPPNVFVESETDRKQVLVQAQLLYTQKIFSAIPIQGNVKPLKLSGQAPMRQLGNKKYQKAVRSRAYTVHEWTYAIFPQKSGTLRIPPAELNARNMQNGSPIRKRSKALHVQVLPRPAAAPGRTWLPARSVKIREKWSTDPDSSLHIGEPIDRTLEITADGLIAEQLPSLLLENIAGLKIYPEKARLNTKNRKRTVEGMRREKTVLIPVSAASIKLPAIELHWWNTVKNHPEIARIPARTLNVVADNDGALSDIQLENSNLSAAAGQINIDSIAPSPPGKDAATTAHTGIPGPAWIIASFGFGSAWLAFAFLWWREWSRRRQGEMKERENLRLHKLAERRAYQDLANACQARDAAAARTALLLWAQRRWPENAPRNLMQLLARGGAELERAVKKLDRSLYGGDEDTYWDGTSLLAAIEKLRRSSRSEKSLRPRSVLPGLYE